MKKILCAMLALVCVWFVIPSYAACNLFNLTATDFNNGTVLGDAKQVILTLKPNTSYTLSSNESGGSLQSANIWFNGDSSSTNSVFLNQPRTTRTDSSGKLFIAIRSGKIDQILRDFWFQLEEGPTATAYTPYVANCVPRSEYTELEYIESDGNAYINTGVVPNVNWTYQIDFSNSSNGWVFGSNVSSAGQTADFGVSGMAIRYGTQYASLDFSSGRHTISVNKTGYTVDGVSRNWSGGNATMNAPSGIYLFWAVNSAAPKVGRIYYFKIFDQNGALIHNFIPVKQNSDGAIGMYDTVTQTFFANAGTGEFIAGPAVAIKVASTKYTETVFNPLNTALQSAISVVDSVVSRTIAQAASIATLQSGKQTRPDETCPAGKKCLLVEDTSGIPHWYEIFDPINRWMEGWIAAGKPAPQHTSNSNTLLRWQGNPNFRETYVDGYRDVYVRQWDASPARTVGGMYQTLPAGDIENAGTWAVEYDGTEGDGVNAGVVYGVAKCTSVTQAFATKLTSANESAFYELPTPVGQTDNANYPRENFKNCWCKMTAVGVPGADGTAANGAVYPVNSASSAWVFRDLRSSASDCANYCTFYCVDNIRSVPGFRTAVFGLSD
ncbi:MAG: hypothetical protein ACLRFM_02510 [Alphaproteobacteria bacterium]